MWDVVCFLSAVELSSGGHVPALLAPPRGSDRVAVIASLHGAASMGFALGGFLS